MSISSVNTFERLNAAIYEKQDEYLTKKWGKFKEIFSHYKVGVSSQYSLSKIFSRAFKISQKIQNDKEITQLWLEILGQKKVTLCYLNFPDIPSFTYNFNSILSQFKELPLKEPVINFVQVNDDLCKKEGIENIATTFDNIAKEAVAFEYGHENLMKMLQDKTTLCFLAKHKGVTVGCIAGSYLQIPKENNKFVNILHLWFIGRQANYPSVRLYEYLNSHQDEILKIFPNLQCLTWNIVPQESICLKEIEKIGFTSKEHIKAGFQGRPMDFYTKMIQGEQAITLKREQVKDAQIKNREKILNTSRK